MKIKIEIEIPKPPNFLKYQDATIHVGELTDNELKEIAEEWKNELLNIAKKQRQDKEMQKKNAIENMVKPTTELRGFKFT